MNEINIIHTLPVVSIIFSLKTIVKQGVQEWGNKILLYLPFTKGDERIIPKYVSPFAKGD